MPDKLGFIYFRYPYGAKLEDGTVSQGVEWVAFHKDDIKGLALRVVDAYKKMSKEKFAPDPSPANCQFCAYESVCEARQNQKRQNARPARVDPMLSSDSDFTEFSLGGKK
jgi:hypothetical protein